MAACSRADYIAHSVLKGISGERGRGGRRRALFVERAVPEKGELGAMEGEVVDLAMVELVGAITCVGVKRRRPRARSRRYLVSAGCSESHREIVEAAPGCPWRDEMVRAVSSRVLPRSYCVRASRISLTGYASPRSQISWSWFRPPVFTISSAARTAPAARSSMAAPTSSFSKRQNTATETAALILPSVGTNYERHPKLQRFMLANDSTTIAVEVPIWLHADDIAAIERRWGIELFPKAATAPSEGEARSITGHIDFLQIRNGAIHILDYKPDATTGTETGKVRSGSGSAHIRRRRGARVAAAPGEDLLRDRRRTESSPRCRPDGDAPSRGVQQPRRELALAGAEGGPFAFNYLPGDPKWTVQAGIAEAPASVVERRPDRAVVSKRVRLVNRRGVAMDLHFERRVRGSDPGPAAGPGVRSVAYVAEDLFRPLGHYASSDVLLSAWSLEQFPGGEGAHRLREG